MNVAASQRRPGARTARGSLRRPAAMGFTLVELMIVVVIISILAALVVPNMMSSLDKANVGAAKAQIRSLKTAAINYKLDFRKYPASLEDLVNNPKHNFLDGNVPLDPWGSSSVAADGCVCTRFLSVPDWPSVTGRADVGLVAARLPDLTLRVLELMSELRLPAVLTRDVLAVATLEFIEHVQPADADDWRTLSRAAAALTREQVEDYTSALTADGPLMADTAAEGRIR